MKNNIFKAVILFLCIMQNSNAAIVTYSYEAIVSTPFVIGVDSAPFDSLLGETMRIEYTYDTNALDTYPGNDAGQYEILSSQLTLGSYTFNSSPASTGSISINNNFQGQSHDLYHVSIGGLTGSEISGLAVGDFDLFLFDTTGLYFSDDSLPSIQPNPSDFDADKRMELSFYNPDATINDPITFAVVTADPVSISAVPVPPAVWLLGSGLLGLIGITKRKAHA